MALVWMAGPLAGVGQPFFGLFSDQCRLSWGKRKPFITGGALCTICSLLMLAWTKDIVHAIAWIAEVRTDHRSVQEATLMMAAVCVWILNFAIQPLQSGVRALIIDSCPPEYMDTANAWASRMISIGSLLGYSSGFVHLPSFLEFSGNSKFKALCVLATSGLVVTVSLCLLIRERDPNEDGAPEKELKGVVGKFKYIRRSVFRLHPLVVKVMKAQFWSWIGWFSFMYYITT